MADATAGHGAAGKTADAVREIRARMSEAEARRLQATQHKRRGAGQQVREARERLTSTTGTRAAFDIELAASYAKNRAPAALAIMALAICVSSVALIWSDTVFVSIWLSCILTILYLMSKLAEHFLLQLENGVSIGKWWGRFSLMELIHGLIWAVMVVHLAQIDLDAAKVFVLFIMLLLVAITTMMSATIPAAVYACCLPVSAAVIGYYALRGDTISMSIAVLAPMALAYFLVLGRQLFQNSIITMQYRAEKDALIGELEQARLNSDEARRRAEEANLAKSRFLATMSHELRTPLNAILGFSEVMKSEVFGPHAVPVYREYAGDIHDSGEHLLNLINEILDLSRIEAGRYELHEESVNLAHVAGDCHHLLKLRSRNRGISIVESFEADLPLMWADERAVRQVTLNLLSNAIKFTPQGGEVVLSVGRTPDGGLFLSVKDSGPGIPEEEIPTVMSSFGQGTLAMKTAEQGAGLGLPIVKGLMDLHGGSFTLESRLREGTKATVTFPPTRVMTALPPVIEEKPQPPLRPYSASLRRAV